MRAVVEGDDARALVRGRHGLAIRLAKVINGRLRPDHARALRTPREVLNGLPYVLLNARKHGVITRGIDPCSSAAWFGGWRGGGQRRRDGAPVATPRTWLLRVGWRRSGSIGLDDMLSARRRGP